MKVLLFSTQWPEYMVELANALAERTNVILMVPDNHQFTKDHLQLLSRKVISETYHVVLYKSIRDNFKMLWRILNVIWKHRPDILHIQSNGHRLFYWIFIFKPLRTKIVNTIHDPVKHRGDLPSQAIDDKIVQRLSKYFTAKFIVHANALKIPLINAYKIAEECIDVVPHGNFQIYQKLQSNIEFDFNDYVLFFGRIWEYKGLNYFIQAANIVHNYNPKIKFCIAGTGENIDQYLAQINNKEAFIILNKRIPIEEVGILFKNASLVVLPYLEATQSGVVPIAYAYSKPVIASAVGGLPEIVLDYETGFLVSPGQPIEIAEKILYLIKNESERLRMGLNAYRFAMNQLSWVRIAAQTFTVYKQIV
jgi:glycosyltransferase involved in cell wall biosynthesis